MKLPHLFQWLWVLPMTAALAACSSPPIKPAADNVEVSREDAKKNCKEVGAVEGRTKTTKGSFEEALEDLKLDASRKGANFVKIEQTGAMGTSVRGLAYFCN